MRAFARSTGIWSRFRRDSRGNVAISFSILAPVLLLLAGGALDYTIALAQKRKLQDIADAAALAGGRELSFSGTARNASTIVAAVIQAYVAGNTAPGAPSIDVATQVISSPDQPLQVQIDLTQPTLSKLKIVNVPIKARAVAVVVGQPNICVLALDPSSGSTLYLDNKAQLIGTNCAVFSNSTDPQGINVVNNALISASLICSSGGHVGQVNAFSPGAVDDCPQFSDPLASRPEPTAGGCLATSLTIKNQTTTLSPGTYCGGINIIGSSIVTFQPGVYVIQGGPLKVDDSSTITGENTGFYFTGSGATFFFNTKTSVNLTAPKDGPMAGLLFFASRSQQGLVHQILSQNARNLLGTLYVPTGQITIDTDKKVADLSAFTAIVTQKLKGNKGAMITLNTNYSATDIPVPDGIKGMGQPFRLAQ